jgi:hypothetical protein
MNALSLIPGIGTTLQLWRLLQNVIVIMSKSVTTMAGAKTEGVALKTNIMGLKDQLAGDAMKMAQGAAQNAAQDAAKNAMDTAGIKPPEISALTAPTGIPAISALTPPTGMPTPPTIQGMPKMFGGAATTKPPTNHLRSIKKYKREYKQSLREIRKTRKKMMKYIKNII